MKDKDNVTSFSLFSVFTKKHRIADKIKAATTMQQFIFTVKNADKIAPPRKKNLYSKTFLAWNSPTFYLKNNGSFSKKMISSLSAASPSANTAHLPTILPPAASISFSIAIRDSPVLITSSTIRILLPLII